MTAILGRAALGCAIAAVSLVLPLQGAVAQVPESCAGAQSVTRRVGPEGGRLELGRFVLQVFPRQLTKDQDLTVTRIPGDPEHPGRCTPDDAYTVEPFLLAAPPGRPFLANWHMYPSDREDRSPKARLCSKVSWTAAVDDLACFEQVERHSTRSYYRTALPEDGDPYDLARWPLMEGTSVSDWSRFGECRAWFMIDRPRRFSFLTDRLGHFRLLAPEVGTSFASEREGDPGAPPPSRCRRPTNRDRRSSGDCFLGRELVGVIWDRGCETHADCGHDAWCAPPTGRCDGPGACRDVREPGWCDGLYARIGSPPQPVCGCDGVTYRSSCHSDTARVPVRRDGACPEAAGGGGAGADGGPAVEGAGEGAPGEAATAGDGGARGEAGAGDGGSGGGGEGGDRDSDRRSRGEGGGSDSDRGSGAGGASAAD